MMGMNAHKKYICYLCLCHKHYPFPKPIFKNLSLTLIETDSLLYLMDLLFSLLLILTPNYQAQLVPISQFSLILSHFLVII